MTECNVLGKMPIGDDTAVVIDGNRGLFRNGIEIFDEEGNPFEVLSVGMDVIDGFTDLSENTSLLIKGLFDSRILLV